MIPFFQCTCCKNLIDGEKRVCEAFPEGIPEELWMGRVSHEKAYEGDNGVRLELVEEVMA